MGAERLLAAGRFDRLVTIVRPAATTFDGHGEAVEGVASERQVKAAVLPLRGEERLRLSENEATASARFLFRRDGEVRVTDRIVHDDGRTYEIKAVQEIGRRQGWDAIAVARAEELDG